MKQTEDDSSYKKLLKTIGKTWFCKLCMLDTWATNALVVKSDRWHFSSCFD